MSDERRKWDWIGRADSIVSLLSAAVAIVGGLYAVASDGVCKAISQRLCQDDFQRVLQASPYVLLLIVSILLFAVARRSRRQDDNLTDQRKRIDSLTQQLVESQQQALQYSQAALTAQQVESTLERKLRKNTRIAMRFRRLAVMNKQCDAALFERLFWDRHRLSKARLGRSAIDQMKAAHQECNANIQQTVDMTASIFSHLTGELCAVSLKVITSTDDGRLITHGSRRDTTSHEIRAKVDDIDYELFKNRAFRDIYRGVETCWKNDDLAAAAACGDYENPRPDYGRHYNATIVHPIHDIARPRTKPIAFLCVDNQRGGFCTIDAVEYMVALTARIEVMSHRFSVLTTLIDAKPKH